MDLQKRNELQKAGGLAAVFHSAAYVVGIGLALTLIAPALNADAAGYLAELIRLKPFMYLWIFICYSMVGVALAICVYALYERMKETSPNLAAIASIFGIIWAGLIIGSGNLMLHDFGMLADMYTVNPSQAQTIWPALQAVEDGLVSGNEMVGSLWMLLISMAALKNRKLPKALNIFGVLVAITGFATLFPIVMETNSNMFFALGSILWFIWLGVVLLNRKSE